jgi:hypothetical protein
MSKSLSLSLLLCLTISGVHAQSKSANTGNTAPKKPTANTTSNTSNPGTKAQAKPATKSDDEELYRTIAQLDAEVFDASNRCDLEKFGSYFIEDLEFYHDDGGLVSKSRQNLVEQIKNNICHKVRRVLVAGTLQVYPLHGYGALEVGIHRFEHPGREKEDGVGEGRFIHLWQFKDGKWQITRVISYDHHPAKE